MTTTERDDLVRDIARRVFAEEQGGRPVDPERLTWAANVLDDRSLPGTVPAANGQVEALA